MQRWCQLGSVIVLMAASAASAQVIPWVEPPALCVDVKATEAPAVERPRATAKKTRTRSAVPVLRREAETAPVLYAQSLPSVLEVLLSSFDGGVGAGQVLGGTSWAGNVTQHPQSIAVGGTASDDNGWGARNVALDASGMNYLTVTAQRDAGNQAPTLFFQFEDRSLRTKVFSVTTSSFAVGSFTTVQIPLGAWTLDFGPNEITGWSIGGGSVGTVPFRMSFDTVSFSVTAIPEPATYGVSVAVLGLATAVARRRWRVRRRSAA